MATLDDWGLMKIPNLQGVDQVTLVRKMPEDDVPAFCEGRIQALRSGEASHGDDRFTADDVRTLEVRYGANGERLRNFRETVKEMQQVEFSDFPLLPRTTLEYVRAIATVSEGAVAQHHQWVAASASPTGSKLVRR